MASKAGGGDGQRITWDEETIAEHDKLRGTRSKIVEANTPFIVYDQDGDTAVERREQQPGVAAGSADALAQEDLTSHWTVEVSHPATRSYHALEIACQKEGGGSNGTKWQPTTSD